LATLAILVLAKPNVVLAKANVILATLPIGLLAFPHLLVVFRIGVLKGQGAQFFV
jgi:hypothetical protein